MPSPGRRAAGRPSARAGRQREQVSTAGSGSRHRKMQYPFYEPKPCQGLRSSPAAPKATSWCPVPPRRCVHVARIWAHLKARGGDAGEPGEAAPRWQDAPRARGISTAAGPAQPLPLPTPSRASAATLSWARDSSVCVGSQHEGREPLAFVKQ